MKEPVLQDKQQEHVKFCKYANELLERVLGKKSSANLDASLEDIRRVSHPTLYRSISVAIMLTVLYAASLNPFLAKIVIGSTIIPNFYGPFITPSPIMIWCLYIYIPTGIYIWVDSEGSVFSETSV